MSNNEQPHVRNTSRVRSVFHKALWLMLNSCARIRAKGEENLVKQLETSPERLRTDYVDILYLHSCVSPQMVTFEPLMNALVKVKKEGKARFLGMSVSAPASIP